MDAEQVYNKLHEYDEVELSSIALDLIMKYISEENRNKYFIIIDAVFNSMRGN